ncbi:MAG: glycosyltransferase family 4 protein [Nanoarchaeota archaeon]
MKILEITNFSSGICGVFARVKEESIRLASLGHEVRIFSSDLIKGGNGKRAKLDDKEGPVIIKRFKGTKFPFNESYMAWGKSVSGNLRKEIIDYHPDIIIAHAYRHTHTVIASRVAKEIGAKSFLVAHAPFGEGSRGLLAKNYINLIHDPFVGRTTLSRFDKIITIAKWEEKYLKALGVPDEKMVYIPNGIPEEFFTQKKGKEEKRILFLGRVAPVKDIQALIKAFSMVKDKEFLLDITGPAEESYLNELILLIKKLKLNDRVIFSKPIYNIKEKIEKIDSAKIFVLPSKREGMPQSLIEAMAREKIVIASKNDGSKELINNDQNGFLFDIGDSQSLARLIDKSIKLNDKKMCIEARKSVEKFSWDKIIKKLDNLIKTSVRKK